MSGGTKICRIFPCVLLTFLKEEVAKGYQYKQVEEYTGVASVVRVQYAVTNVCTRLVISPPLEGYNIRGLLNRLRSARLDPLLTI